MSGFAAAEASEATNTCTRPAPTWTPHIGIPSLGRRCELNRNSATTLTLSCETWNQMQALITRPPPRCARLNRGRTLWSASPRGAARICLLWSSLLSMPDGPFLPHTIPHATPPHTHARTPLPSAPLPSADILNLLSFPNRQRRPSFIKHRE